VPNQDDAHSTWLPVIGKALAYLCLQEALRKEPGRYDTVLKRVQFLQALGLSRDDAAHAAGSSPGSVRVMHHHASRRKTGTKKARMRRRRRQ
jgi:hypothetical protein